MIFLTIKNISNSSGQLLLISILCLWPFFQGCKEHRVEPLQNIQFVEENIIDIARFELSTLELEATEESYLHGVSQFLNYGNLFFILDNVQSKKINIYDESGKYIKQLGSNGRGPGEYVQPWSISIDRNNHRIAVLDVGQNIVLYYDLDDFSFIRADHIPFNATKMEFLGKGNIGWYGSQTENAYILITDSLNNIIQELIPRNFNPGYIKGSATKNLSASDSMVLFYTPHSPILYDINADSAKLKHHVSFENFDFPSISELTNFKENNDDYINYIKENSYIQFCDFYDTPTNLYCNFFVDKKMYFGFYDKSNNRAIYHSKDKLMEFLKIPQFFNPVGVLKDFLICRINNVDVLKNYEAGAVHNKQIDKELRAIEEDSGFVMLLIKFND
ncbi:6-bladed beta-propeller [Geofilum rubicundum]|nr:6-bladed beta-propeller [Geofilum rubicundum]